jgi:hypothetical protein
MNQTLVAHADAAMVEFDRVVSGYRFSTVGLAANPRLLAHANKSLLPAKGKGKKSSNEDFDLEAFLNLLREGKPPIAAARAVHADPAHIKRRMQFDRPFRDAVELAESEAAERIEEKLYQLALRDEKWAMQEWLKKRYKDRWGDDPTIVQHQGTVNHEIGAAPLLDQIAALEATLRGRAELTEGSMSDSIDYIDAEVIEDES